MLDVGTNRLWAVALLLATACTSGGGSNAEPQTICGEAGAPATCGEACEGDGDCGAGTFCLNRICDAVCTQDRYACNEGARCTELGRCEPIGSDGGIGREDAGACPDVSVRLEHVVPNIMLIVDRTGSMVLDFNGKNTNDPEFVAPTRWEGVLRALVGDEETGPGLLQRLEGRARFGLAAYNFPSEYSCPGRIVWEDLSVDSQSIQTTLLGLSPGGATPTGAAVRAVTERLSGMTLPEGPTSYVLATDGLPNRCWDVETPGQNHLAWSADTATLAVEEAYAAGYPTSVIGVNFADGILTRLANAGAGQDASPDAELRAPLWTANSAAQLAEAFTQSAGQQIPCEIDVVGVVDEERACEGDIQINGERLACNNAANGWRLTAPDKIELLGNACERWRYEASVDLSAYFPCGAVIVE